MPPKAKQPKAPKAPKPPKPVKLSKKALAVLDKAEVRHIAVKAMGLSPNDGAYRLMANELVDWVIERQELFASAELSACNESALRPGVLQYVAQIQANLQGKGPPAEWPPRDIEISQETEEDQMDHDFSELDEPVVPDDDEEVAEDEAPTKPEVTETIAVPVKTPVEVSVDVAEVKVEPPKPVKRVVTLPPPAKKPTFMPVSRDTPKPSQAPELPGTITENIGNMNNRINEMCDRLEQVTNSLDSKVQQIRSDITTHSTKARVDAVERTVKKLDQDMQILSTAVLHLINTIRPWADIGINTFPNLESLPDASMYGDDINKEVENG